MKVTACCCCLVFRQSSFIIEYVLASLHLCTNISPDPHSLGPWIHRISSIWRHSNAASGIFLHADTELHISRVCTSERHGVGQFLHKHYLVNTRVNDELVTDKVVVKLTKLEHRPLP
jgi:hypothetical protein